MKKLITILAITSLFSFQAFAQQLASSDCNTPDSTCQAFEVQVDGEVLEDFVMTQNQVLSLGKVRRGELINVVEGDYHRGKSTGYVTLQGALNTNYTISCSAADSIITYSDGLTTQALDSCAIQNDDLVGDFLASHSEESIQFAGGVIYEIAASIQIDENAPDGGATGVVHLEVAYE